jgi:hypothetical protein
MIPPVTFGRRAGIGTLVYSPPSAVSNQSILSASNADLSIEDRAFLRALGTATSHRHGSRYLGQGERRNAEDV